MPMERRMSAPDDVRRVFGRFSASGIFFQGGAAAIDTGTIVATLVHGLTGGSAVAVGAAATIARAGWLLPQILVGYLAQRRTRRMPFYVTGAFGRAACLIALAGLLWLGAELTGQVVVASFVAVWTVYAFVGGIVAVPYNDIVARSVPSDRRSRLLAVRFFGGGVLALLVAAAAHRILTALSFNAGYAALLFLGAILLLASALFFVSAGEPAAPGKTSETPAGFGAFLREGFEVVRNDRRFRLFLFAQWLGGVAAMALPFYVLQATSAGSDAAILLGAQTVGALLSNPLWGWWGDRLGKTRLLAITAALGVVPPALTLGWMATIDRWPDGAALPWFIAVFALLGAAGNGATIAQLGFLMEVSPNERRPAYSGYFNSFVAPVTVLPVLAAALAEATSYAAVFAASGAAALLQIVAVRRLRKLEAGGGRPMIRWRRLVAWSWLLSWCYYWLRGTHLEGRPKQEVWYFAFGANMHDSAFRERRGMCPLESRAGRVRGYRLRFNLDGRPRGKAAPANLCADPWAEVWGVLYSIRRRDLVHLDSTEGVPGRRYRHLWVEAEDSEGNPVRAVTYIADGNEVDGNPSLRYITLLRDGARAHGLPEQWVRYLESVKEAT
jgi:MFS family permease